MFVMGGFEPLSVSEVHLFLEEPCKYVSAATSLVAGLSEIKVIFLRGGTEIHSAVIFKV